LDAAKFFRDTGISREDLEKKGIPMQEKIATEGLSMSKLDDSLFRKTIDGDISPARAAIIGGSGLSHAKQRDLNKLIESQGKRRSLTDQAVQELAEIAKSAETQTTETLSLFGTETTETSTVVEKAKLQAAIKSRLSRERKLFGTVARGKAADELKRGGNTINREKSSDLAKEAAQALGTFDQMKNLSGPIASALNEAAARVANGENIKKVERDIYGRILKTVQDLNQPRERRSA
jgi:ribosomal protein L9